MINHYRITKQAEDLLISLFKKMPMDDSHLSFETHLEVDQPPIFRRDFEQILLLPHSIRVLMAGRAVGRGGGGSLKQRSQA